MKLQLTPAQISEIMPHMKPGITLLGRITREVFTGDNARTCGRLLLEYGEVPEASLPSLREVIKNATKPAKGGRTKK